MRHKKAKMENGEYVEWTENDGPTHPVTNEEPSEIEHLGIPSQRPMIDLLSSVGGIKLA